MTELPYDLDLWRARIPLLATMIPLNNCSHAPPTRATLAAIDTFVDGWSRHGMDWDAWISEVEAARTSFARLIGASPADVGVTTSVSQAVSSVASAVDFSAPRNTVLVSDAEFPTVSQVWLAQATRGASVRQVCGAFRPEDLDVWDRAMDRTTAVVSVATAWYRNGELQDVASLCRLAGDRGALSVVDAYQTLGTGPLDVGELGADVLTSGCLKYLLGVPGLAFVYVRPDVAEKLSPTLTGWFGRRDPFAFDGWTLDWAPGARRFDTGTPPVLPAFVCRAGLDQILEVGAEAICGWTRRLSARLAEVGLAHGLTLDGPLDPTRRSPTTAFRLPNASELEARLRDAGVLVSARGPVLRFAPHFYNSVAECDRAMDLLAGLVQRHTR